MTEERIEQLFQKVMHEVCKNPLHRFAELVAADERKWVGLTDQEIFDAADYDDMQFARNIEAALRSKNDSVG